LKLNHITIFDANENIKRLNKKGQKDVCTAKKGLVYNIIKLKYKKCKKTLEQILQQ
jgi:hypothetical protein